MTYAETHAEATTALTACNWTAIRTEEDSALITAARHLSTRRATMELRHLGSDRWSVKIVLSADGIGVGSASTALEAVLAAQCDAVHALSELAHLCGSTFGRVP